DLIFLYNGALLTLWLSEYEGFGLPLLESMACGTPVITTSKGSIPEVIKDVAILIKNPTDSWEISQAIEKGIKDTTLREKLRKEGLKVVKMFSWEKCARETLARLLNC
ncbi:unnamed protein product, partial [marine sediment metagenome]